MTNPSIEPNDPRVERILNAAQQHGENSEFDHEVGDLQDVLRAAWSLMSTEQRNQLMSAAETVNVLQAGDDFIEVATLRGCLVGEEGLRRVVIEVTRDGGDASPRITGLKVFDHESDEIDWQAGELDTTELNALALRLDRELLAAMPPQSVTPAWVSTIDWDLARDVLTQSVRIEGVDRNIQPSRWRNASEALDRHLLPESGDGWGEERIVVMELAPGLGAAIPRWAELTLNTAALDQLRVGMDVRLGGPSLAVRAGGAAEGEGPSTHFSQPDLLVRDFGQSLQLAGYNEKNWPVNGGRVPLRLFLQWCDERPAGETLFVSEAGELLNHDADFARHHLWVDEYYRAASPAFAEPESEFDGERPRG